jgi:4-hydroxybenzoate polyprenyltransferase
MSGKANKAIRAVGLALLVITTLFLAQFGVQAAFNSPPQAAVTLVATAAFAVATYRFARRRPIAGLLFVATAPLFLFSLAGSLLYPDESPVYVVVSAVPPLIAGTFWFMGRRTDQRAH